MPKNLLSSPRSRAEHLGLPMPDDTHAVSACLPLWDHNVGYEEDRPDVMEKLYAGYPRFCFHPIVSELCDRYLNSSGRRGLPFVSEAAANRAAHYVKHNANADCSLHSFPNQSAVAAVVDDEHFSVLRQYWQHAGENVSSRVADSILNGRSATATATIARSTVRDRFAACHATERENVFLFPSGMAAIAAAWRATMSARRGICCQFGFPYVDTLKAQERFPGGRSTFLPVGNKADFNSLEVMCRMQSPRVIFCEAPANPLLVTPDLHGLRRLADAYDILLVVDDTLAACENLATLSVADLLVTSLTKYFSGYGNVLAGALIVNPHGRHASTLLPKIQADFEETLSDDDVEVLCENSADYRQRLSTMNANATQLVAFLQQQDAVESVYYPSLDDPHYEELKRDSGGYGALLSIVLRNPAQTTVPFFDSLNVCKGPNLGTTFTLCCPYTLLAHYNEFEFAERCGVSRWLLRISVGTEPADELIDRFRQAIEFATM